MDIVAGPQGSGKSTFFPVADRGCDFFNVDDRRRQLNGGFSQGMPPEIQRQAVQEYEEFIEAHIRERRSFSFEATLAKDITFRQAAAAQQHGFRVHLTYVGAELDECLLRVALRWQAGGHGVTPGIHRQTYAESTRNLSRAIDTFTLVQIYDNSLRARLDDAFHQAQPRLVFEAQQGRRTLLARQPPRWLAVALANTDHAFL